MLSDFYDNILEVHAHYELWSFVNGGAEVCSILFLKSFLQSYALKIVCLRPVKGRYVTLTIREVWLDLFYLAIGIYSKCKYICSFKY
jgi:hypothetical protein